MMNFPSYFVQLWASQSPNLVRFSGAAAGYSLWPWCSAGLNYGKSWFKLCNSSSSKQIPLTVLLWSWKRYPEALLQPLFFYDQIETYPSLMKTLLPLCIRHMLKARSLIHSEPVLEKAVPKTWQEQSFQRLPFPWPLWSVLQAPLEQSNGTGSRYHKWGQSNRGSTASVVNCCGVVLLCLPDKCCMLTIAACSTACQASLRMFLFPLQPFSTLLL